MLSALPDISLYRRWLLVSTARIAALCTLSTTLIAAAPQRAFLENHCYDCHGEGVQKGCVNFAALKEDLADPAAFSLWERVHDRLATAEMPPPDKSQPPAEAKAAFLDDLSHLLTETHAAQKGTVLRRLNRLEYENTLNDMFGTTLKLAELLPHDGRSGEFDTVGEALNLSMEQLRRYLEAADLVIDEAIAKTVERPELTPITASYKDSREGDKWIGKVWKELPDGAVVRFNDGGYPTGMMRSTNVRKRGRYRVKVTAYAYQSDVPVTAMIAGTSFARGSTQPIYTYHTFHPGEAQTVEFETIIDKNYMMLIEPYGLFMKQHQREEIESHDGPGLAVRSVEITGPLTASFPSQGHNLIFNGLDRVEIAPRNPKDKLKAWYKPKFEIDEDPDITLALQALATRAFRRPVGIKAIIPYVDLFENEVAGGSSIEESLRTAAAAILCAPDFLYLQEQPGKLDDRALASRLAYFLTRSLPDRRLVAAANEGTLGPDLRSHTERLLTSKLADRFITDFTDAWLDLREIDFTNPDNKLFPEYDRYLQWSMLKETRIFFRHLLEANLPVTNLIKADFAFLNERLATHYHIKDIKGAHLRKVLLPPGSPRGGILSQGAVLKVTANGNNTSPVVRGVWVLERLLGIHPQPPPPGIAGVEPDVRGASTLRELLDKHRDSASCNACHQLIDPPGFALESFNPIGGWRDRFRSLGEGEKVDLQINNRRVRYKLGREVDAAGQLPNGRKFDSYLEFRDHLASDSDTLAKNLTTKLLTFATGREMGFSDRSEIDHIVTESAKRGHGVRNLIHLVVASNLFRTK